MTSGFAAQFNEKTLGTNPNSPGLTGGVSPHLTSLGPQSPHKPAIGCLNPWSTQTDRIFRNEGVTGSNPVSSTPDSAL